VANQWALKGRWLVVDANARLDGPSTDASSIASVAATCIWCRAPVVTASLCSSIRQATFAEMLAGHPVAERFGILADHGTPMGVVRTCGMPMRMCRATTSRELQIA